MNNSPKKTQRKKWLAAIMSIIMPGLGQTYNGEVLKGFCFLIFFAVIPLLVSRMAVYLPDSYLMFGLAVALGAALGVYILSIILAARKAGQTGINYKLKPYNSWYAYTALWLAGLVLMAGIDGYLRQNVLHAYKIVGKSMTPQVLPGDQVIADLTTYKKNSLKVGDIIILVYPDDRSKVFIRRIEGLPGDRITQADGGAIVEPHGTDYVLGNAVPQTGNCLDSREFGPVDLRDVVGKVRLVYFSIGADSIRWNRIGRTF